MQDVTQSNWLKRTILRTIAITLIGLAIVGPLAGTLLWSFAEKWYWPSVLPQEIGLKYWRTSLSGRSQVMDSLWISLVIAVIVVVIVTLVSVPAGYALARYNIPWKRILLVIFLMPQAFPQLPVFINMASIFYRYNLVGTIPGVVAVPCCNFAWFTSIWITTASFLRSIPAEDWEEASCINLGAKPSEGFLQGLRFPLQCQV